MYRGGPGGLPLENLISIYILIELYTIRLQTGLLTINSGQIFVGGPNDLYVSRLLYNNNSAQKLSYRNTLKFLTAFIRAMNVRHNDLNLHLGHFETFLTSVPPSKVSGQGSYSYILVPRLLFGSPYYGIRPKYC